MHVFVYSSIHPWCALWRVVQEADGGGKRSGETASQPDSNATAAGGLPEVYQPAGDTGPALLTE